MTTTTHRNSDGTEIFVAERDPGERGAGVRIEFARWGAGPRWLASFRLRGHGTRTRWFDSREACEAWRDSIMAASPESLWKSVDA